MHGSRTILGAGAIALAAAVGMISIGLAADEGKPADQPAPPTADQPRALPTEIMPPPMREHMERSARIKQLMQDARALALAGNEGAAKRLDDALRILDQDQQAMRLHMSDMMAKMKQRTEELTAIQKELGAISEQLSAKPGNEDLARKLDDVRARLAKLNQPMMGGQPGQPGQPQPMADQRRPKVVNDKCPIMGGKIDRYNVPDNLIREFEGKKVGFCCGSCPAKWDTLSDQQKRDKLAAVMPKE